MHNVPGPALLLITGSFLFGQMALGRASATNGGLRQVLINKLSAVTRVVLPKFVQRPKKPAVGVNRAGPSLGQRRCGTPRDC
jgi:hypothetical protein